jgi:hypothetical protein
MFVKKILEELNRFVVMYEWVQLALHMRKINIIVGSDQG